MPLNLSPFCNPPCEIFFDHGGILSLPTFSLSPSPIEISNFRRKFTHKREFLSQLDAVCLKFADTFEYRPQFIRDYVDKYLLSKSESCDIIACGILLCAPQFTLVKRHPKDFFAYKCKARVFVLAPKSVGFNFVLFCCGN